MLAENDRTVEQQLSSLGLLDPNSAEARVLGLLLVGFDASAFVPGAYTSPGGPYGVVTKETFAERNDYRNPALAAAMKTLGYVNRFGRGITLVRVALEQNGNPPAEFQVEDTYWSVTVRRVS